MKNRYLIAFDSKGIYLRQTLSVLSDINSGEITYYAKPITHRRASNIMKIPVARLCKTFIG